MTHLYRSLVLGCSVLALAACGPEEIASPGTGGNINIDIQNPAPAPAPAPTPTPTPTGVQPAAGCPQIADDQGLIDQGTITGATGTYLVCALPNRFNESSTLPYVEGVLYRMAGRVDVGTDGGPTASAADTNVVLTIDPGVIIYSSGEAFLNVNRGNQIQAVGTAERPIIFTSRENVLGENTDTSSGQWGGLVLSGRAPVTDCAASGATPGTVNCERGVEGSATPANYGGATANDSSGRVSYVQLRFSGFALTGGSELQSLTTGGTGSNTQFDHIQSFNSSDDGVEFFGGTVNMKNLIIVGAEDDSIDSDTGVKANLQYVVVVQNNNVHDTIIEADSNSLRDQVPRQNTQIANFLFIQQGAAADGGDAAVYLRGGTDYALVNGIIISPDEACIRVRHSETIRATDAALDDVGPPVFHSVVAQCGSPAFIGTDGPLEAEVQALFTADANNSFTYTPTLTNLIVPGANETAVVAFDPGTLSSFFDTTTFIGAVSGAEDSWYTGWTCNSATISFGEDNTGACTSLPVYD